MKTRSNWGKLQINELRERLLLIGPHFSLYIGQIIPCAMEATGKTITLVTSKLAN